jgi:hypothetical protein
MKHQRETENLTKSHEIQKTTLLTEIDKVCISKYISNIGPELNGEKSDPEIPGSQWISLDPIGILGSRNLIFLHYPESIES